MQAIALRQNRGKMPSAEQDDRIGGGRQHSPPQNKFTPNTMEN
jgi:hypothetical protein